MQHKLITFISIALFSIAFTANGQKLINSPYSRFNIGTLEPAASFRSLGMGGVGTAMRDNTSIFFSNPASYSSFDTVSFTFDFGVDYSMVFLHDGASTFSSDDANFDHLLMGFPIRKGWGVALGVVPISNGYYKMSKSILKNDPAYDPNIGEYSTHHEGSGGLTSVFLGTGLKLTKNFSAGANLNLLFGQLSRLNQFSFSDFNVYNDNNTERLQLSGINFDYGLQYTASFKNDYFLNAGISLSSDKNYKTKYDHFSYKYTIYGTSDTISYLADNTTKTFIPGTLRLGVALGKKNKLVVGFDFISTKWSGARIPGSTGTTADTKMFIFGAEYIPDKYSNYSYLKRVEYRIGAHTGDNYLVYSDVQGNKEQLKEYGASLGIGLPMGRAFSKANLFIDFTHKGNSESVILHSENFYTMGISLNFYDIWFLKRKYE
jgi:hypothetical protein